MKVVEWSSPFGYTIFCDDIRQEIAGKFTLVGVYGLEMTVFGTLPTRLAKLALSVAYVERIGESEEPLELLVYVPGDADDAPTLRAPVPEDKLTQFRHVKVPPYVGETPWTMLTFQVAFSPIELKQEGALRVRMIRGDEEIELGALRIRAQPPLPGQANQDTLRGT
jgi:hypothetical protein